RMRVKLHAPDGVLQPLALPPKEYLPSAAQLVELHERGAYRMRLRLVEDELPDTIPDDEVSSELKENFSS
ncbi:MAG: hypothetical protein ACRD8U_23145, partial [Pyrinomonadaceae bacterium]